MQCQSAPTMLTLLLHLLISQSSLLYAGISMQCSVDIHLLDSCNMTILASTAALNNHVSIALVPNCWSERGLTMSATFPLAAMLTVEFTSCTQLTCEVEIVC